MVKRYIKASISIVDLLSQTLFIVFFFLPNCCGQQDNRALGLTIPSYFGSTLSFLSLYQALFEWDIDSNLLQDVLYIFVGCINIVNVCLTISVLKITATLPCLFVLIGGLFRLEDYRNSSKIGDTNEFSGIYVLLSLLQVAVGILGGTVYPAESVFYGTFTSNNETQAHLWDHSYNPQCNHIAQGNNFSIYQESNNYITLAGVNVYEHCQGTELSNYDFCCTMRNYLF